MLPGTGLREERVECIVATTDGLVAGHLTIRLNAVFQTEQLPARVTDLDTGLTDVNAKSFPHLEEVLSL
jgi:hypothetical protein